MSETNPTPEPKPTGSLARDVAVILLVGIALGVGHNAYLLGSGPRAGLSWIKTERKLVRLEDLVPDAPDSAASTHLESKRPAPTGPAAVPHAPAPPTSRPASTSPPATSPQATTAPGSGSPGASAARREPSSPVFPPTPPPGPNPGAVVSKRPGSTETAPVPAGGTPGPTVAPAPVADAPAIPETREPLETGIAVVRKLHAANAAVFVDARTAGEYAEGHIAGALHLSFDDVFRDPELAKKLDDRGLPIVAYCGGGDCDLSRNLAFSLIDAGHKRVLVFLDGIAGWKQAGLPVNTGSQP